jgi:alpha-ketoglutarate-dependent taurine dioxygenase
MLVEPIKPHIGAVIRVDRSALCEDAVVRNCLELLEERGVLVFPAIGLTDEEQLAFTDKLGPRVDYYSKAMDDPDSDGFYKVSLDEKVNKRIESVQATFFWHMDGFTTDLAPPKATLLSARKVAPKGGQTEFASTYAAYEQLPAAEKKDLEGLRVRHTFLAGLRHVLDEPTPEEMERIRQTPEQEHPIVWTHKTGRKSLVIGTQADRVVDMPVPNGRALLVRLMEWAAQPDFTYRHQWQEGDLVIWDNPGALHRVIPYDRSSGRLMHRTSIAGTEQVQ